MKIKNILKDLIKNLDYHLETLNDTDRDYYHYDRSEFLKFNYGLDEPNTYDIDIESLSTHIIQMKLFGHIIYTEDDEIDIRKNKIIKEKK